MKLHPRVTRPLLELVKRFEGLRRKAARLPDGRHTIGYGHVVSARAGAEIGAEDAEALLRWDLGVVASRLEAWCFAPLTQNQFEALVAFAFNIGLENFRECEVLRRVNAGDPLGAAEALERWRYADVGGELQPIDALVRRRAAEKLHFLTPPEGFPPSPSQVLRPRTGRTPPADAGAEAGAAAPETGSLRSEAPDPHAFPAAPEPPPPPLEQDAPFPSADAPLDETPAFPAPAPRRGIEEDPFLETPAPVSRRAPLARAVRIGLVLAGAALFLVALAATLLGRAPVPSLALGLLGILSATVGGLQLLRGSSPRS